jgi:serine/threonine protein kinase/formylglycine-generating enzyme required for sulfatase activity
MPDPTRESDELNVQSEVLLGKVLLDKGILTREQLEKALSLQIRQTGKTLPHVLVSEGLVTREALRSAMADAQMQGRRRTGKDRRKKEDEKLGALAVEMGFTSPAEVEQTLSLRNALEAHGIYKDLGELLFEKGHINRSQFDSLLAELKLRYMREVQTCPDCGKKYNVAGLEPGRQFRCRVCQTVMTIGGTKEPAPAEAPEAPAGKEGASPGLPETLTKLRARLGKTSDGTRTRPRTSFTAHCEACGKFFRVPRFDPDDPPLCVSCGSPLGRGKIEAAEQKEAPRPVAPEPEPPSPTPPPSEPADAAAPPLESCPHCGAAVDSSGSKEGDVFVCTECDGLLIAEDGVLQEYSAPVPDVLAQQKRESAQKEKTRPPEDVEDDPILDAPDPQPRRRVTRGLEGTCSSCGRWFRVPNYHAGQEIRCIACGSNLPLEGAEGPEEIDEKILEQKTVILEPAAGADVSPEAERIAEPTGEGDAEEKLRRAGLAAEEPPTEIDTEGEADAGEETEGPLREFGPYPILEEIARGGMGIVYLAWDPNLDRRIALKVMAAGGEASRGQVKRFKREISTTAKIRHKNIVTVFDVGVHKGHHYYTMEYIEGPSLAELVGKIPLKRAVEIVESIANALHVAHEAGVLHRDLKPANILLDKGKVPKVVDFGLAKDASDDALKTRSGTAIGTPAYMSPEAVQGRVREISKRSDVYSLGVILYELLTTRQPFRGDTRMEVMMKVVEEEPAGPRSINPRIPADLEAICLRAMAARKRDRYRNAGDLAEDLRRFREGEIVVAKPLGIARRLHTSISREAKVIFGGLLCALSMLSVILGLVLPVMPDVEGDPAVKAALLAFRDAKAYGTSRRPSPEPAKPPAPAPREPAPASQPGKTGETGEKPPPARPPEKSLEDAFFEKILRHVSGVRTVESKIRLLRSYLDTYPDGKHTAAALERIRALKAQALDDQLAPVEELRARYIRTVKDASVSLPPDVKKGKEPGTFVNTRDGADLVLVPGGSYSVGSDKGRTLEGPRHAVKLSPFLLCATEVTSEKYARFLNEHGGNHTEDDMLMVSDSSVEGGDEWNWGVVRSQGRWVPAPGCARRPVTYVTWYGARAYAKWAGGTLPTEAQWEAACRGWTRTAYYWGDADHWEYMWYSDNARGRTHDVGKLGPNPFGLWDMSGNVSEWCRDYYTEDFYARRAAGGTDPINSTRGPVILRVVRGGALNDNVEACSSFRRESLGPLETSGIVGFRYAIPIP